MDEMKRNLARSHQGEDWTIQDLRQTLKQELRVLEAGSTPMFDPTPTASFYTGVKGETSKGKPPSFTPGTESPPGKVPSRGRTCPYCKGNHSANKCTIVVDPKIRKSIVSKSGLCYNCLSSSHRSAKCSSKYRCRNCGGKHHTTICEKEGKQNDPPLQNETHLRLKAN